MRILPMPTDLPEYKPENANAALTLDKRYRMQDSNGEFIENYTELFWRVASAIAIVDNTDRRAKDVLSTEELTDLAKSFYLLMQERKFLPNSPCLMNAGKENGQLAACFVLPIEDNMESIFDTLKNTALIHKSGGGTGFSFGHLRPKDSRVNTTNGVASGPISFMKIFNEATEQIKQGGTRRGASMGVLPVHHPDIEEFIHCKEKDGVLNNFNISVAITDKFMDAVKNNEKFSLIDPKNGAIVKKVDAQVIWDALVQKAWQNGDPGVVFIDTVNKTNTVPGLGPIESPNPCGESFLLPYEACDLGSINLAAFAIKNAGIEKRNLDDDCADDPDMAREIYNVIRDRDISYDHIDWWELRTTVRIAVRFLDNLLTASHFSLKEITDNVLRTRKIGLGVMGFGDMLFKLGVPYNSKRGRKLAEVIMKTINLVAFDESVILAKSKGSFPAIDKSIYVNSARRPRNAIRTIIAPTGSISLINGCSSGIEPLFALAFTKHVLDGNVLTEYNKIFEQKLDSCFNSETVKAYIAEYVKENGSLQDIENNLDSSNVLSDFKDFHRIFITAPEISPEDHLKMQAAFQKYTDNAISKTINLPYEATVEDVDEIYRMAYDLGCKGVTVYRDGSKSEQVLYTAKSKNNSSEHSEVPGIESKVSGETSVLESNNDDLKDSKKKERPITLTGFTTKVKTGHGTLYVTINETEDGNPFEIFCTIGKPGKSIMAKAEAIGRLSSLAFRLGATPHDVYEQLVGISGESAIFSNTASMLIQSIPDAVAWVIKDRYFPSKKKETLTSDTTTIHKYRAVAETTAAIDTGVGMTVIPVSTEIIHKNDSTSLIIDHAPLGTITPFCPDCAAKLVIAEGCVACPDCGWSKCS